MNREDAREAVRQGRLGIGSRPDVVVPLMPGSEIVPRGYRCAVCTAGPEIVSFVNKLIVSGSTAAGAHRALTAINEGRAASGQPEIGYQSVQRHAKDHLPAKSAAVREIIERRARAAQLDVDEGTANILTTAAYAEAMMTKAMQDMADADVSPIEGLQAAKFFHQLMQSERGNAGLEAAFAELGYIIAAVKEIVPQRYWAAITSKIEEKRGSRIIDVDSSDEFDPGEQPDEMFDPIEDQDSDF